MPEKDWNKKLDGAEEMLNETIRNREETQRQTDEYNKSLQAKEEKARQELADAKENLEKLKKSAKRDSN